MISLVIPRAPPSLNQTLRMHWSERRRLKQLWIKEIWVAAFEAKIRSEPRMKSKVEIDRRSPKLLDEDNCYGAIKVVLDALKDCGLIEDDSPEHIELRVSQSRGAPQTTIRIEAFQARSAS
jgi:hypothetical protein